MVVTEFLLLVIASMAVLDFVMKYTKTNQNQHYIPDLRTQEYKQAEPDFDMKTSNLVKRTPIAHTDKELYEKELAKGNK